MKRHITAFVVLTSLVFCSQPVWALRVERGATAGNSPIARATAEVSNQPPLSVSLHPITRKPRVGEPVVIEVKVISQTGVQVPPIEYVKEWGDWELLSDKTGVKRKVENHFARVDQVTLRTFVSGEVEVPAVIQPFRGADQRDGEFRSAPLSLKVAPLSPRPDDQPGRIRGLKDQRGLLSPWWVAALVLLLTAVAGVVVWLLRRKQTQEALAPEPVLPPEVVARQRLAALRASRRLAEGQFKGYYSELSDILRRYLEQRYHVTAPDLTTHELMRALKKSGLKITETNLIRDVLDQSDMVKFAKFQPQEKDAQADWETVDQVVEHTTPVPLPAAEGERT